MFNSFSGNNDNLWVDGKYVMFGSIFSIGLDLALYPLITITINAQMMLLEKVDNVLHIIANFKNQREFKGMGFKSYRL